MVDFSRGGLVTPTYSAHLIVHRDVYEPVVAKTIGVDPHLD